MGALPSRQTADIIFTLRYGSHEIALIPLTRRYFGPSLRGEPGRRGDDDDDNNNNDDDGGSERPQLTPQQAELRRQFVRMRNDTHIRFHHLRDPQCPPDRIPAATYTEARLEDLLDVVEATLFDTDEELFAASASAAAAAAPPGGRGCPFEAAELDQEPAIFATATDAEERVPAAGPIPIAGDSLEAASAAAAAAGHSGGRHQDGRGLFTAPDVRLDDVAVVPLRELSTHPDRALSEEEKRRRRLFKRAVRPVPCAVCFVYTLPPASGGGGGGGAGGRRGSDATFAGLNIPGLGGGKSKGGACGAAEADSFAFRGRRINVIGYFGCRTVEGDTDDLLPFMSARQAILKAAGDRTLEHATSLAVVMYRTQFLKAAERLAAAGCPHVRPSRRGDGDEKDGAAEADGAPPLPELEALFLERVSALPLCVSASWNTYPTLKFLYDTIVLMWAAGSAETGDGAGDDMGRAAALRREVRRHPPRLSTHVKPGSGEGLVVLRAEGALIARGWAWLAACARVVAARGDWVMLAQVEGAPQRDRLVAAWLAARQPPGGGAVAPIISAAGDGQTTPRAALMLARHLETLHAEIVRARGMVDEPDAWVPGQEETSHDGKLYRIFSSPRCGPFLTTVKRQAARRPHQGPGAAAGASVSSVPSSKNMGASGSSKDNAHPHSNDDDGSRRQSGGRRGNAAVSGGGGNHTTAAEASKGNAARNSEQQQQQQQPQRPGAGGVWPASLAWAPPATQTVHQQQQQHLTAGEGPAAAAGSGGAVLVRGPDGMQYLVASSNSNSNGGGGGGGFALGAQTQQQLRGVISSGNLGATNIAGGASGHGHPLSNVLFSLSAANNNGNNGNSGSNITSNGGAANDQHSAWAKLQQQQQHQQHVWGSNGRADGSDGRMSTGDMREREGAGSTSPGANMQLPYVLPISQDNGRFGSPPQQQQQQQQPLFYAMNAPPMMVSPQPNQQQPQQQQQQQMHQVPMSYFVSNTNGSPAPQQQQQQQTYNHSNNSSGSPLSWLPPGAHIIDASALRGFNENNNNSSSSNNSSTHLNATGGNNYVMGSGGQVYETAVVNGQKVILIPTSAHSQIPHNSNNNHHHQQTFILANNAVSGAQEANKTNNSHINSAGGPFRGSQPPPPFDAAVRPPPNYVGSDIFGGGADNHRNNISGNSVNVNAYHHQQQQQQHMMFTQQQQQQQQLQGHVMYTGAATGGAGGNGVMGGNFNIIGANNNNNNNSSLSNDVTNGGNAGAPPPLQGAVQYVLLPGGQIAPLVMGYPSY